ncbi:MAG: hypothetical protein ABI585_09880 [Betaproteobacteria bacterium]
MNLTFHEKNLWLLLVALGTAFGWYFVRVLPPQGPDVMPHQIALFVLVTGVLVVAEVLGIIAIAIVDRRAERDERDRLIELKGTRNGAYVLATGVFAALCTALATTGNFAFTHVLLASWLLAQLVEIVSQLAMYRRGA